MDELIPDPTPAKLPTGVVYAGFWRRFNAYGIDATIVWFICVLVQWAFYPPDVTNSQGSPDDFQRYMDMFSSAQGGAFSPDIITWAKDSMMNESFGGSILGADTTLMIVLSALYNILFAVSHWMATPGKRWLKMKITMVDGSRLTLQQSAIRHVATAISAVLWMVPCITVAFTKDKLAPHDMIVGSRVIHELK